MVDKRIKKKKFLVKLAAIFLLLISIIISYRLWLPLPATFLLAKDNLGKADCIVPLQGGANFRVKKAVELYYQGYAKNIVASFIPKMEDEFQEYNLVLSLISGMKALSSQEYILLAFKYFGMGPKDIYFTDFPATSTYEEAVVVKKFMLRKGFKSMILVTSTYHTRRALNIFKWVFRNTDIKIYNCTAKNELYNPYHWWEKETDVKALILEYASMVHNFIYYLLLKK